MLSFIKQFFSKRKKWDDVLSEIVEKEQREIVFPVIMFFDDMDREFSVFQDGEEIINQSIYGHWSGVSPICPKFEAFIVDSLGNTFEIVNEIYDKEHKVCYSFPKKKKGKLSLPKLKRKLLNGCNEYIEIFEDQYKEELLKGKSAIEEAKTIMEVVQVVKKELSFL